MSTTIAAIYARTAAYQNRRPSPVVERKVANQMQADRVALLREIERMKAAP